MKIFIYYNQNWFEVKPLPQAILTLNKIIQNHSEVELKSKIPQEIKILKTFFPSYYCMYFKELTYYYYVNNKNYVVPAVLS